MGTQPWLQAPQR